MLARIILALALLAPGAAAAGGFGGPITPIDTRPLKPPVLPANAEKPANPLEGLPVVAPPVAPPRKEAPKLVHDVLTTPQGRPFTCVPEPSRLPPAPGEVAPIAPPPPGPPPPLRTTPVLPKAAQVPAPAGVTQEGARPDTRP